MLPSIVADIVWIPALLGLGALVRHGGDPALRPGIAGLLGLGVAGVVGTLLNFWIPVGPLVSAAIWIAGCASFLLYRRWLAEAFDRRDAAILGVLLVGITAAMRSLPFQYDTGFYHLQAVRWITERRLPLGLANVHHRLGFNSLWLVVAAALEDPVDADRSSFFLNQLPVVFAGQIAVVAARRLVAGNASFPNLLLVGTLLPLASATFGIGGLYVDYTEALVVYLAIGLWAHAWEAGERFADDALPAAALSVLALVLKITSAPLAAAGLVAIAARRAVFPRRERVSLALTAAIAVVPWLARGVLLSGCVAFPVASSCIDGLPWAIPRTKVENIAAGIASWARTAGGTPPGGVGWVGIWWTRVLGDYPELRLLLFALALGIVLCVAAAAARRPLPRAFGVVLAMALAGIAAWFPSAPDPRFALGSLYALGLAPLLAGLAAWRSALVGAGTRAGVAAALLIAASGLAVALDHHPRTGTGFGLPAWRPPMLQWPGIPRVTVVPVEARSGLVILVPGVGESCGAEPIPCAPLYEFDPALRYDGYFTVRR